MYFPGLVDEIDAWVLLDRQHPPGRDPLAGGISFAGVIAFIYADLITLPILLVYRKYYGTHFAVKLTGLMLAAIVIAALAIDAIFSAAGLIPESRLSIESVSDRGISLNYTALLNAIFTLAGGLLLWLTIRRGVTDPVCGMRVDRQLAQHRADHIGRSYFFCSAGCRDESRAAPETLRLVLACTRLRARAVMLRRLLPVVQGEAPGHAS